MGRNLENLEGDREASSSNDFPECRSAMHGHASHCWPILANDSKGLDFAQSVFLLPSVWVKLHTSLYQDVLPVTRLHSHLRRTWRDWWTCHHHGKASKTLPHLQGSILLLMKIPKTICLEANVLRLPSQNLIWKLLQPRVRLTSLLSGFSLTCNF